MVCYNLLLMPANFLQAFLFFRKINMKNLSFLLLMLLQLSAVRAQENKKYPKEIGDSTVTFGYVSVGYVHNNFEKLNNVVKATSGLYETVPTQLYSFGLGWVTEHKKSKIISVFDFFINNSFTGNRDKKSTNLLNLSANLNIGYNFSKKDNYRLYPYAGVGFNYFKAKLHKDVSGVDFTSVLTNPTTLQSIEPVSVTNNFLNYNVGFGFDLFSKKKDKKDAFGIFVSYQGGFTQRSWKSKDNQTLANAPSDKLGLFTIGLRVGGLY